MAIRTFTKRTASIVKLGWNEVTISEAKYDEWPDGKDYLKCNY